MKDSLLIARSLYKAIKELEEAHRKVGRYPDNPHAHLKKEDAENHLAQVLESLKQWTIEL